MDMSVIFFTFVTILSIENCLPYQTPNCQMNKIYHSLSASRLLKNSYTVKFLFVAFIGIHIPLIGLIVLIFIHSGSLSGATVFTLTLILTLAATASTLYILKSLLEPLKVSHKALESYLANREIPELPTGYPDEAGMLMKSVQETINSLDLLLEEKKDFIGLLSHDLRTPLTSILLMSSVLERKTSMSDEERRRYAAHITSSTKAQIELFQHILEILKNDDIMATHLKLEECKIENLIENSMSNLQEIADQKEIHIMLNCNDGSSVKADFHLITQVIKNLLSNAIKFSHPGSTIEVVARRESGKVKISIADHGLGFDPDDADKLFEKWTDRGKAGTINEISTGMGLYLSNKIVKAHNGYLHGESEGPNLGAKFTVELYG